MRIMRAKDLVKGESYRHKDTPEKYWATVKQVMPPKSNGNPFNRIIVRCYWSTSKGARVGLIKHFKPSDLVAA